MSTDISYILSTCKHWIRIRDCTKVMCIREGDVGVFKGVFKEGDVSVYIKEGVVWHFVTGLCR